MVRTRKNEYLPMRTEQIGKNLERLETTFDASLQAGKPEPWVEWQEVITDNVTSVLAYIEKNELRMENVEGKIEEIEGEVKHQVATAEKACFDHTNLAERFQDNIRRKELTKLENDLGSRISALEGCVGAVVHRPPGIPSEWTEKFDIEHLNVMREFETEEKRLVFMKSCVGLVNGLFKFEWQAHVQSYVKVLVKNYVESMLHSNSKSPTHESESNLSEAFSEENPDMTAVDDVTHVVNIMQKQIKK